MAQPAVDLNALIRGSCWDSDGLYYPASEEDDVPLSAAALRLILYLYTALCRVFETRDDVWVGADQFVYWDSDDRSKCVAPDGYVIFGVPKLPLRAVIRLWEEAPLAWVAEVSSEESRADDRGRKFALYRDVLRVPEYLIYDDPTGEVLYYNLQDGEYVRQQPDADGRYYSHSLGVWFALDPEIQLRVIGPDGAPVPWTNELFWNNDVLQAREAIREGVVQRLHEETEMLRMQVREERDQFVELLEEERQRAEAERQSAEAERQRAEEEHQRAEEEHQRAEALAAELERLRRALERRG